jgi:hypothetical protein
MGWASELRRRWNRTRRLKFLFLLHHTVCHSFLQGQCQEKPQTVTDLNTQTLWVVSYKRIPHVYSPCVWCSGSRAAVPVVYDVIISFLPWLRDVMHVAHIVLCCSHPVQTGPGPTQPPTQWVPGAPSLSLKLPEREAKHSPISAAEV